MKPSLSSLYQSLPLAQDIPPFLIGERANANGSKAFRKHLLADNFDGCLTIALEQEKSGAHAVDLCVAYAGRDEVADMTRMVSMVASSVRVPLVIDATNPDAIAAALKIYPGRALINSINLEDGGKNMDRVCGLAKKYGAAVIALTIDETGMAMTADEKVAVAQKILKRAVDKHGLRAEDLVFDPLTFTIGSGDESLRDAAVQTLIAVRRIKDELPGVFTSLGVSNVSFGLKKSARKVLNSIFLHEAVAAGLDVAIVDPGKILPLVKIAPEDRESCLDLIYNRQREGDNRQDTSPLMAFIAHFENKAGAKDTGDQQDVWQSAEWEIQQKLLQGEKEGLEDTLAILLQRHAALEIVNTLLVPEMRHIGELFGKGEILLPFVLKSAEVMKLCVQFLEPHMTRVDTDATTKVLLATVRGDVHDIGKNLVDIILSNNGYKVFNLGIKVPEQTIIQQAREHDVDIIGLSGLLVKSAIAMQESMPSYQSAGLKQPILLGGAALTEKFVAESCVPNYSAPVVYCADAFAGLKAVREFEAGTLKPTTYEPKAKNAREIRRKNTEIDRTHPVPKPPFLGSKIITDIGPEHILPLVNKQALFRGRWGYRRGTMTKEAYQELIDTKVSEIYKSLIDRCVGEKIITPNVAYGYFPCHSDGNQLIVRDGDTEYAFDFPRQSFPPHFCVSDFFKTQEEGGDVAGFFVVTIGSGIGEEAKKLFESDAYHDYLMLHGFSVEVTDALAEYWHEVMRREMGISSDAPNSLTGYVTQQYQGSRYGFGYPACPDLHAHEAVFALLDPKRIGVTLTETMEMVPEQTTSAIIAHHPQAKYFAV
ncbi:MAG: dihydropteroate synthase [Myxococcota bacterium]|nr:dihydropteroate synthase [Myxococcota bacterium]